MRKYGSELAPTALDDNWTRPERQVTVATFNERSVFQAISAAASPSRFHYSQFKGACGAGCEQDGF
jgi:hypothetical protein